MLRVGTEEAQAITKVIESGQLFRYRDDGGQCRGFERRYGEFVGAQHVSLCASGTLALQAALAGVGLGPGDEVIVPAHTYMATAIAVLSVGAIPVIVDVDESITLCPKALEAAIGPRTRGVIPVHMWGLACDMDAIMAVAKKHDLKVVEDACQMVGGGYKGRMAGSIGHAGAFSFNYFKNMTCGEGGCVVTNDEQAFQRMRCMIDCCAFYWNGRDADVQPFAAAGARASEIDGAMMNAQLDRLPTMIDTLRRNKQRILREVTRPDFTPATAYSLESEAATNNIFLLPSAEAAGAFAEKFGCGIVGKTGRHTYTEWDPILAKRGAHHPLLDPFQMPANQGCRMNYSKDMCPRTLSIINRAVMIGNSPDHTDADVKALIQKIRTTADAVLGPAEVAAK